MAGITFLNETELQEVPWLVRPDEVTPSVEGIYTATRTAQDTALDQPEGVPDPFSLLDTAIDEGASLVDIEDTITKNREIRNAMAYVANFTAVDTAMATDPYVAAEVFKVQARFGDAQSRLMDYAEEAMDDGTFGKILEVIDALAYYTVEDIITAPRALLGKGGEATAISEIYLDAARNMDDSEFDYFVNERLSKLQVGALPGDNDDGGLYTTPDNYYLIVRELEALDKAGYVMYDNEISFIASGLAVAEGAYYVLKGAQALSVYGRSLPGRFRNTVGTNAATQVAGESDVVLNAGRTYTTAAERRAAGQSRVPPHVEDAELLDDIAPSTLRSNGGDTIPPPVSQNRLVNAVTEQQMVQRYISDESIHAFGAADNVSDAFNWAVVQARKISTSYNRPLQDMNITNEGMQNFKASWTVAKQDGLPFKSYSGAASLANKFDAANVVDVRTGLVVNKDTGSGQFVVALEQRYDIRSGVTAENIDQVSSNAFRRRFGRAAGMSNDTLVSNLADQAEFGALGFKRHYQSVVRDISKLKKDEYEAINTILTKLRDAPDMDRASKEWYTVETIAQNFEDLTGKPLTNRALKAYESIVELSDFSYFIEASKRLQDLASQKSLVVKLKNNVNVLAFPRDSAEAGSWVFNVEGNVRVRAENLPKGTKVYQTMEPMADESRYVANIAGRNRLPELNDALGYNPGGHRTNPNIRHFIGTWVNGKWTTLLGSRTAEQGIKAVEEWNNIIRALGGRDVSTLNKANKEALALVVRANHTFNPNLEDMDDVLEFAKTRGIDLTEEVSARPRGTQLGGNFYGDKGLFHAPIEKVIKYTRQDSVLMEFGGIPTINPDPILSVVNRFNKATTEGAKTQYRLEHATAWAKAVYKAVDENRIAKPLGFGDPYSDEGLLRNIKFVGNTKLEIKFRNEQEIILRRLGTLAGARVEPIGTTAVSNASKWGDRAVEAVYDRKVLNTIDKTMLRMFKVDTKLGTTPILDDAVLKAGDITKGIKEFFIDSGSANMMSLGFLEKMTAPDNFILQSTHAFSIAMATAAAGNLNGFRATLIGAIMRMTAQSGTESSWRVLNGRLAGAMGISDDVYQDLLMHFKTSGRGLMRGAVADDPSSKALMNRGVGKVKNLLGMPFYAGEDYAATVSRVTSFLDVAAANPKLVRTGEASTDFWNKVIARDRNLSFGMNSAQKSGMQTDEVFRMVGQWESFRMAAIESIFFNKSLSKAERAGFAGAMTAWYGALGLGGYAAVDAIIPDTWNEETRELILYGPGDYINRNLFGVTFGTRISPIAGVTPWAGTLDKLAQMKEDPFNTIPSTKLASESGTRLLRVIKDMVTLKDRHILAYDAARLLRVMKVVDSPVLAFGMMMDGTRTTATGGRIPNDWDKIQVVMQALGFTPSEATDIGIDGNRAYEIKGRVDRAVKESKTYFTQALDLYDKGDLDGAAYFLAEGNAIVDAYDFGSATRTEVIGASFGKTGMERLEYMTFILLKNGITPTRATLEAAR